MDRLGSFSRRHIMIPSQDMIYTPHSISRGCFPLLALNPFSRQRWVFFLAVPHYHELID
ncbi:hypothetical protein PM082_016709 [Marasmius tenuissimus]|nr:hypothetical protein PM082_016709 [Marasmius tenuissimus]